MEDQVRRSSGKQPWKLERKQTENGNIEKWIENSTIPILFPFSSIFLSCASRCNRLSRVLVARFFGFFAFFSLACPLSFPHSVNCTWWDYCALCTESRNASCYPNCSRRQTYHTLFPFDPPFNATESNREKCSVVDSSLRLAFVCVLQHTTTLAHRYRGALAP